MEGIPDLEYGGITASGEAQPVGEDAAPMRRAPGFERAGPPGADQGRTKRPPRSCHRGMNALRGVVCAFCATLVGLAAAPVAAAGCGWSGYSYAGVLGERPATAVAATVTALRAARVESGHVAAWVGVGGAGAGPAGRDVWLQTGLVARAGRPHALYVEWKRPGSGRRYVVVQARVRLGEAHRLLVRELPGRPSVWRAFVDGRPVSPPLRLGEAAAALPGVATAESWDGGRPACNRFAYRYENVAMTAGGQSMRLLELEDPGYRIERRERTSFLARSRR
jgi:hypothetical protein